MRRIDRQGDKVQKVFVIREVNEWCLRLRNCCKPEPTGTQGHGKIVEENSSS